MAATDFEMRPAQERGKNRIEQQLNNLNPLRDEEFCAARSRDLLFYDDCDDAIPRAVKNRRLIAKLWSEAERHRYGQTKEWSRRIEPSYHAILAEGFAMVKDQRPPDYRLLTAAAKTVLTKVIDSRMQRDGADSFFAAIKFELLLAIEELASNGLTPSSLVAVKDIEFLSQLAYRHAEIYGH
jgi:hypothetical protein